MSDANGWLTYFNSLPRYDFVGIAQRGDDEFEDAIVTKVGVVPWGWKPGMRWELSRDDCARCAMAVHKLIVDIRRSDDVDSGT